MNEFIPVGSEAAKIWREEVERAQRWQRSRDRLASYAIFAVYVATAAFLPLGIFLALREAGF